ncbi:MAG: DUF6471 domain-containing protein [Caulobacteraceae bacterium]|jgi:hypothetical protein
MAAASDEWADLAKRHIKATLKRHDVGYAKLAELLTDMGLAETEGSVTVKINRGAFPAWWLMAVMRAVGAHTLHLE